MIGGLQGEFGDLDIKYLKQNILFTLIRPFSGTRRDSFLTLARILPFPGTDPDDAIFRYSHRFDPFLVLHETVYRHSHGFPVLTRIMPFSGTHTNSTLFRYSPRQFFDTRTDSTFSR